MTDVLETGEPTTGELLDGRYRLVERIGEGGMARVYRAEDTVLERTVAVKVLRAAVDDVQAIQRAHSEITLLAALNHHSLVTLYDAAVSDESGGYLVMEHVDGKTLRELVSRGPVAPASLAAIALDLAEGLHVAHQAGIVHRDIKPSNVLMWRSPIPGQEWRAKLADFGIACLLDSARITTPGTVVGTLAYVAPEQAGGAVPAPPADIYALGILLIEALTGRRPFAEAEGIGALTARLVAPAPIPGDVAPQWRELLRGMTAREPDDRPTALEVAVAAGALMSTAAAAPAASAEDPTIEMVAVVPPVATPLPPGATTLPTAGVDHMTDAASAVPATPLVAAPATLGAVTPAPATPAEAASASADSVASARPDRRGRVILLILLAAAALAIATIVAVWSASLAQRPLPSPDPAFVEEQVPRPGAPADDAPAPVPVEEPVPDDAGGGDQGDVGTSGGGTGNDNSDRGNDSRGENSSREDNGNGPGDSNGNGGGNGDRGGNGGNG